MIVVESQAMSASERPAPRPSILEISAYVPGRSHAPGVAKVHKLSSNETPLGPSPKAIEAFKALADSLEFYPDGSATALREAIGRQYGLDPSRIICGTGSDELISLLAQAYLTPGDEDYQELMQALVERAQNRARAARINHRLDEADELPDVAGFAEGVEV